MTEDTGHQQSAVEQAAEVEPFDMVEVIHTKRDGHALADEQIDWVIDAYTRGVVAEEQMSALAMAIFLRGMGRREISRWTHAMIDSGERMDFAALSRTTTDKHSTGGVGDKITLPLAPLVASFGVAVPQLSGRGLGHTGGTLDKLEAIPGWRADLSNEQMMRQLGEVGAVICAAGSGLAPADKKLYALRDVTGVVEAIPLIASSIMSKKIAEGTAALTLDFKTGAGAFMTAEADARELARTMVDLGTDAGVRTVALLTDMSAPLGRTAGNALEVRESLEVLAGGGPADVVELTCALAREMLAASGVDDPDVEADARALARTMVDLGTDAGVRTVALLTDMSAPLGRTAGNALEVRESLEVLAGGGPADVVELTCALAREMLAASGVDDPDVEAALADGRAMDTWRAMITAQGGDVDAPLPEARHVEQVRAESDG